MVDEETITIPKSKYLKLLEDRNFLNRLYAAGVDNWEGYSEAQGDNEEDEEDDEYTGN